MKSKGKQPFRNPTTPLSAAAGGATRARQTMLDHQRLDQRDINHLVLQRLKILTPQQRATVRQESGWCSTT